MKGDFSRDTFDPLKHFSRVLMQQGRVQLDADWNEQTSILLHYVRTLAKDILGPHAGPQDAMGFEIITQQTPDCAAKIARFEAADAQRQKELTDAIGRGDAIIAPGRYYVQGVLVDSPRAILYTEQPGYGSKSQPTLEEIQNWRSDLLAYLDVWERHVTYVEDDHIREVALGGPDSCTRAEVAWQVRVLFQPQNVNAFDCNAVNLLKPIGTGRLRARARLDKPPTEMCVIPPASHYRGAENQLYRVEVHRGGPATADDKSATFKWSRENGSVTLPIRSLADTTATLELLGRDSHSGLSPGDWVEVVDDAVVMRDEAGPLAQVDAVDRDRLTVTLKVPSGVTLPPYSNADAAAKHALLRRWDHAGDPEAFEGALQVTERANSEQGQKEGWIKLEDGVEIWFVQGGDYRAGDYWLIPARTATGDVEWPDETDSGGTPKLDDGNPVRALRAPHGPIHFYAPLLLSERSAETGVTRDCRCAIRHLPCFSYLYAFGGRAIGLSNL